MQMVSCMYTLSNSAVHTGFYESFIISVLKINLELIMNFLDLTNASGNNPRLLDSTNACAICTSRPTPHIEAHVTLSYVR